MLKNTDNPRLSPNRRRNVVENDDFAAFARRIVRAHSRRIAAGDIEGLAELVRLEREIEAAIGNAVTGLHRFGFSWTDIAARLGVSRQAVRQRWGGEGQ